MAIRQLIQPNPIFPNLLRITTCFLGCTIMHLSARTYSYVTACSLNGMQGVIKVVIILKLEVLFFNSKKTGNPFQRLFVS